jgi:glycosyltransferase involved in cell wall biosynthesis
MTTQAPRLSIVIPAYNEERRLPLTLERIAAWIRAQRLDAEILVVDDGSADGTARVACEFQQCFPKLRLVSNGRNRGKGFSVRHGMLEALGGVALFTDADLSAPIEEAPKLLEALATAEVAFGSRALDRSLISSHQSRFRELAGILFNKIVQAVLWIPFVDTQCGFKAFRMDRARIIFEQQRIERFGFDPELLFLAKRHGLRAVEIPVRWAHHPDTKVRVFRDSFRMLVELLAIRWNWLRGRYPRFRPAAGGETC